MSSIYIILKQPHHWPTGITKIIFLHQYHAGRPYFVDILMTFFYLIIYLSFIHIQYALNICLTHLASSYYSKVFKTINEFLFKLKFSQKLVRHLVSLRLPQIQVLIVVWIKICLLKKKFEITPLYTTFQIFRLFSYRSHLLSRFHILFFF